MNIPRITRLSSAARMTSHPAYRSAKAGSLPDARRLVSDILPLLFRFTHLQGFVCPVMKPSGNRIPLALAEYFSQNSGLQLCTSVRLKPAFHSNAMIDRLHYIPEFSGDVFPGKYVIVDDVYTSGSTLAGLKHHIESHGGIVVAAFTIGSSKSTCFQPDRLLLKILLARFPEIDRYYDIDLLTAPQVVYMLRFSSLRSLHERYYSHCLEALYA
jgi:hypothetical protein